MTQERDTPGDPAARTPVAAALADVQPYVLTAGAVALFGTPAEIAVPIVRRLRGRAGVSAGPGVTNLVNGIAALGVARYFRQRPARWQQVKVVGIPPWLRIAVMVHLTLSPAAAAGWERGVILRGRSPLWGALVQPVGLLPVALVLGAVARAGRTPSTEVPGAAPDDA